MLYDLIIVGGGTAGLSAALYGLRGGLNVLLLEQTVHGGQIVASPEVENYPALPNISGAEYAQRLFEQVYNLGLLLKYEAAEAVQLTGDIKHVRTAAGSYQGRSFIWATGVVPKLLNLPNEERLIGRGISLCATCDGALYKGRETAVVGGGNTALEEALFLSRICSKVHVLHRRDSFRAESAYIKRVKETPNIQIHFNTQITGYEGENRLESIQITDGTSNKQLQVAAVFLAVGKIPANALLAGQVALDETGYIQAGEDCMTAVPGVFAAGDCRTKPLRQLVTAAADGAMAASQAISYLKQQEA